MSAQQISARDIEIRVRVESDEKAAGFRVGVKRDGASGVMTSDVVSAQEATHVVMGAVAVLHALLGEQVTA